MWVDLTEPTREQVAFYKGRFGLDDLAIDDCMSSRQRPKLDQFAEHALLVLKTVRIPDDSGTPEVGDAFIFFSDSFVLTVSRGADHLITGAHRELGHSFDDVDGGTTAIVHHVVDLLVDQYLNVSARIVADVSKIEDSVFDDDEPASSQDIYKVKREIIELRRAVQPLIEPLTLLKTGSLRFIDPTFTFKFADVRDHLLKVMDEIDAMERVMDAALQANLALISVKQNEDMRKISAWVGIAALPTMVAGVYGMNFDYMPETGAKFGYFVVVGVMIGGCFGLFRVFRRNKWL